MGNGDEKKKGERKRDREREREAYSRLGELLKWVKRRRVERATNLNHHRQFCLVQFDSATSF